ncbi:centrosomal protein of 192 kDa isoform X1 [Salvelinus alpinus]|uniref:centrosomal protein of 192 kDa isoform X1 n=1 Tax=Salvelinus alpinus TaxID=8036 RepID=UPI0039FCE9F7
MTESFSNIEDEAFPSFLSSSVGSSRATLGNVTLASTLGLPVAASTMAKIRAGADNRVNAVQASYLEDGRLSLANSQSYNKEQGKFALSFKDELDNADDFIAAHRFSDMLVKVNLDETESRTRASSLGHNTQTGPLPGRHSEHGDDLSMGRLAFTNLVNRDFMDLKVRSLPGTVDDQSLASDGADSDRFSGSVSSFLANEKLMSMDSMNSDVTDDDIDVNDLQDEDLDRFLNKLVSPAMQRGRVEGQEIPVADQPANQYYSFQPSSTEPQKNRYQFLDDYDQGFQMPDVRLAATGMDSCPGSDEEDTEDELEAARGHSSTRHRLLLSSTSRQLVGESHRPSFRPGLEGGSSDEEAYSGRNSPLTGYEHRYSAEGQVINTVTGGGGDGSSGSEDGGSDGVSTLPLSSSSAQTTYDVLRGLGILGASVPGENAQDLMGDRVGPVGTGETSSGPQSTSPVNWSMSLDRQEALDAMDSTESGVAGEGHGVLDSIYLRTGAGHWRPQDMTSHLQTTQSSFHLSQVLPSLSDDEEEEGRGRPAALGPRGGPCGDSSAPPGPPGLSDTSQGEKETLSTSLEAKYLSQSFHQEDSSDSDWNHCPDNLDFQPASHSVVYQNEEGKWVTDLAYYSSFEKEVDGHQLPEVADQFQAEDFVPGSNAIEKIIEDQKEFEKENQFMQEEVMEPASTSPGLLSDTSWRLPASSHILMRASQVSQELDRGNQSYLRLSLGTFFQQRSEALGCLGDDREDDTVKRPSFGYVITSPEKREPFPLIQPSDFLSQDGSVHNDTLTHTDHDHTMNTEDLDKTVEAAADRVSPTGDDEPEPCESASRLPEALLSPSQSLPSASPLPEALLSPSQTLPSASPLPEALLSPGQSLPSASPLPEALLSPSQSLPSASPLPEALLSPGQSLPSASPGSLGPSPGSSTDQSNLTLSISTIASAISDASISSEPSQLAAMIMELSKRSRIQRQQQKGLPGPDPASVLEEQTPSPNQVQLDQPSPNQVQLDQRILLETLQRSQCAGDLLETLQRSQCAGDLSAFDIEKYLKQTEVSTSSDSDQSGSSHYTFDFLSWADSLNSSRRKSQAASLVVTVENESSGYQHQATEYQASTKGAISSGVEAKAGLTQGYPAATTHPVSAGLHPGSGQSGPGPANKTEVRRSSIPRPRASSIPTASGNPGRRSVVSGQYSSTTSSTAKPAADRKSAGNNSEPQPAGVLSNTESGGAELGAVRPTPNNTPAQKVEDRSSAAAPGPKTSPGLRKGLSGPPSLRDITSPSQRARRSTAKTHATGSSTAQQENPSGLEKSVGEAPPSAVAKRVGFTSSCHSPQPAAAHRTDDVFPGTPMHHAGGPEQSQCTFRPSTSPLTHSSPSQTSFPSQEGTVSPPSSRVGDRRPPSDLTPPQSEWSCSSPSLSRLTYISLNDSTDIPTPDRHKSNGTMSLSTTIVRASPTPPVDGADTQSPSGQDLPLHRSTDILCPPRQSKSPESPHHSDGPPRGSVDLRSGSGLGFTRSQSECNYHRGNNRDYNLQKRHSVPNSHRLTKVDSGYSSHLNIQQPSGMGGQGNQQWSGVSAQGSEVYPGSRTGFGLPSSEDLCYVPISSFKPQGSMVDLPPGVPGLLTGRSLFSSQLAQQNLGSDGALHPGHPLPAPYRHMAAAGNGLYGHAMSSRLGPNVDPSVRHLHSSGGLGVSGPGGPGGPGGLYHCSNPHLKPLDPGLMEGNPYSQSCVASWSNGSLPELTAQVVIPEELRFPHACCVGISSQTSLGIFNPSERWQQVSITVTSLAIDGEKVDSFPYQWLIVKNKTIIGPKSTEEQKVLFIPPQAGVYQAVLSVSSWPASAEAQAVARAEVFAKRVVLVAMAENPALEVDVGKCGSLDFGDLAGGSAKALPLKLLNRTHATVPIRLVISANATAWRCFTFSKSPVAMTAEGLLQAGTLTSLAAPSVMSHVMHASYGENAESFMVWVHFHAPQKYQSCSGDLGPADEYSARVDIEVDCPGPSHVIRSVPLRARSGTARVHAPKDLQTVNLSAALGQSSKQTLPLKNAGNIDVQLKLKNSGGDDCFSVSPVDLCLRAGEEQGIVVSFTSQGGRKSREGVLTILVLPSGPQYEVVLKGQVVPEERGNPAAPGPASALGMLPPSEVPPILSNKQFVAWGGVTLGRAVQQKLVLRNNSPDTTHHLRLLIRGQDHSCFQLQSSFGQEERLTRHRELSIRPREDVVVHLLFAPTRVACTLSKLEIKQSGVRPSQPGIKFTIPLSGYGGTSNIILEDHRKRSDGYVAMLMGVAAGQVSKLCVCVRNTGSRAAFIKAVPYSDLHTRSVMDSSVISLSPSQFVLMERTQEVITVLMKVTQREQTLCQSANAVLATVCLFCGDEVSRQQFRRLLLSKPEAGRKILSENSLLKGLNFNERFPGEEQVLEAYDLPQSPNQAQLFYGNLSKVVLSVLGSTETLDSGRTDLHVQPPLAVTRRGSEADSGFENSDRHISNVSLDVLPVKGPQGPALPRTEASGTGTEPGDHRDSWSLRPEQLVLTSPTINGASNTRHVLIQNHSSSRELSFELSWPAHCLTVTPQHGVVEPQCHLQILISPNPSLATRTSMFPWSGQIYVQCDNQQKFIKVQIRQDLALDVSTAPADRSLAPLPPQTASPMPTTTLPPAGQPPQTRTAPATVEISNRTIVFPATPSGETSESSVEVENGGEQVRWYLSSFAPPYVKGVDSSGDVYRATYTAFRCPRVSGTLAANHKMQVPITFLPRDRGDYAQFWDLECHPVAEPQHKTRIRFQLCGTGVKVGPAVAPQEADCSLVKTEAFKTRRRPDPVADGGMTGQEEALCRGVYAPQDHYSFPPTRVGETSTLKVNMRNNSLETHGLMFLTPKEPFHIKHSKYSLRSQRYIHLPVQFKPVVTGNHSSLLLVQTDTSGNIAIQLTGEALTGLRTAGLGQ